MRVWFVAALLLAPAAAATLSDGSTEHLAGAYLDPTHGVSTTEGSSNGIPVDPAGLDMLYATRDDMAARWQALDATCDPDAVFALMYLRTTETVVAFIESGYFDDGPFMARWTVAFAEHYTDAYDGYLRGEEIPAAWQTAFDYSASGKSTVTDNILQGMNAHINYDLGIVTEQLDITLDGRKTDFDRINDALAAVVVDAEIADRYGPEPSSDAEPGPEAPLVNAGFFALIIEWREEAWNHAVLLEEAHALGRYSIVAEEMEAESLAYAQAFQTSIDDTSAERTAYCQAHHAANPADDGPDGGPGNNGRGHAYGHNKD